MWGVRRVVCSYECSSRLLLFNLLQRAVLPRVSPALHAAGGARAARVRVTRSRPYRMWLRFSLHSLLHKSNYSEVYG